MDLATNTGVIVMRPQQTGKDVLDEVLIGSGRFDRQIYVDLPDLVEKKAKFLRFI